MTRQYQAEQVVTVLALVETGVSQGEVTARSE